MVVKTRLSYTKAQNSKGEVTAGPDMHRLLCMLLFSAFFPLSFVDQTQGLGHARQGSITESHPQSQHPPFQTILKKLLSYSIIRTLNYVFYTLLFLVL